MRNPIIYANIFLFCKIPWSELYNLNDHLQYYPTAVYMVQTLCIFFQIHAVHFRYFARKAYVCLVHIICHFRLWSYGLYSYYAVGCNIMLIWTVLYEMTGFWSTLPNTAIFDSVHLITIWVVALQWRYNEHVGVSNHQPRDCLLTRLFKAQIKENIKAPRQWPLCGEFTGDRWILHTQSL